MNLQAAAAVVVNEAQGSKAVHEKTHSRSGGAYHLSQGFLTDFRDNSLRHAFLAEMGQQEQNPR